MPAFYRLRFLPADPERPDIELSGSRGNYYELDDGTQLDVLSEPIWCRRCGGFKDGEQIETLAEIDQQLVELHDPTSEKYKQTEDSLSPGFRLHWIEKMIRRREWRSGRQSPPRCLECGSTDIVLLPPNEHVLNPNGPGWIVLSVEGLCSTWFNNWYFTPEGERIPRDTKPSYWTWAGAPDE